MSTAFMILMFDPSPNAIYLNKFCRAGFKVRGDVKCYAVACGGS